MKLKEIAEQLGVSDVQIRQWKNQDKWDEQLSKGDETKSNVIKPKNNVMNQKATGRVRVIVDGKELQPIETSRDDDDEHEHKRRGRGRIPLWESLEMTEKLAAVRGWCMHGSTDAEICEMLGISTTTFYEWKNDYPEFADAVRRGKEIANGELLNAAFRLATGYRYLDQQAIKVRKIHERTGMQYEEVALVDVEKISPPNQQMLQFMLKNRLAEDYKDKQEIQHGGAVTSVDKKEVHIIQEVIQQDATIANKLIDGIRAARLGSHSSD